MTDLETLIAELAADNDTPDGHDTTYVGARAVLKIARELAATRAAIAEWREEYGTITADATLMETMDRIAEGILE